MPAVERLSLLFRSIILSSLGLVLSVLHEGVLDHLAAVDWADEHQQRAARNHETEGSGLLVAVLICSPRMSAVCVVTFDSIQVA